MESGDSVPRPLGFFALGLRRQAGAAGRPPGAVLPAVRKVASALELHPCRALSSGATSILCDDL